MKGKRRGDIEGIDRETRNEGTTIEVDIPEWEDCTGPETFREAFDIYGRSVLKARNAAKEGTTEKRVGKVITKNQAKEGKRTKKMERPKYSVRDTERG